MLCLTNLLKWKVVLLGLVMQKAWFSKKIIKHKYLFFEVYHIICFIVLFFHNNVCIYFLSNHKQMYPIS